MDKIDPLADTGSRYKQIISNEAVQKDTEILIIQGYTCLQKYTLEIKAAQKELESLKGEW